MENNDYLQCEIGTATGDFLANGQTIKDTALMDLINNVQMYYGEADLSVTAPLSSAGIPRGTVMMGDVYAVYTYNNYLFAITITGAQMRKYLEFSVGRYYKTYVSGDTRINKNSNIPDYNYDILQGAEYTVDLTKSGLFDSNGVLIPGGQPRITKLTFKGREIQDNQVFKLAMNSYRFNGGGGFLKAAGIKPQSTNPTAPNYISFDSQKIFGEGGQVRNLMVKYFQDTASGKIIPGKTSVEPVCDNNWQTVPRFFNLVVFTDVHGAIDNNPKTGTPQTNAALLSATVNREKAIYGDERTILLSNGDMMQGTAISNILRGKPVINVMNQMEFDAMEMGNHELDWGIEVLHENVKNAKFPFLVANLSLKPGDTDAPSIEFIQDCKPWVIINKDGLKVGIIGVITPDTANIAMPSVVGHFLFHEPSKTVSDLLPKVKSAGADIVVVLAHIGDQYNSWPSSGTLPESKPFTQDLARLVKGVSGVTAIFGGHSHTINYDLVPDATETLIPVVIGNCNGKGAGIIRLALDSNNNLMGAVPGYFDIYNRLYSYLTPDPAVQAIVDAAKQEIEPIISQVIGQAKVDLTRDTAIDGNLDSNLGSWAADVIRNSSKAVFAFQHAGGLRTDIPMGDITVGDIWTLMPFDNYISVMDVTGAQIKTILEYIVSGIKTAGHVSGLRFTFDSYKPARFSLTADGTLKENPMNSRITWITLPDGTPINLTKTYKLAAPDYIATGGDYYPIPRNATYMVSTHVLIRDAMMNDIKNQQILNYLPEGRIQYATYSSYQFVKPTFNDILANQEVVKDFGIKAISIGNSGYLKARVNVTIDKPAGASVEMLYYDPLSKKHYDAAALGYWGPKDGMPITPDFIKTDSFQIKFSQDGEYTIRYALVDLETNKEIVSESSTLKVLNTAPTITTTLGSTATKDEKRDFTVSLVANNAIGKTVWLKITVTNPKLKDTIKFKYIDLVGKDHDVKFDGKTGVALFGPKEEGFTLSDMTILFKAEFKKTNDIELIFELVQVSNEDVLTSISEEVKIYEKKK